MLFVSFLVLVFFELLSPIYTGNKRRSFELLCVGKAEGDRQTGAANSS